MIILYFLSVKVIAPDSDTLLALLGKIYYWHWNVAEGYRAKNYPGKGTHGHCIIYYDYEYKPDPEKVLTIATSITLFIITGSLPLETRNTLVPTF